MLFDGAPIQVVQVAVVQVIDMTVVPDSGVATIRPMLMRVTLVRRHSQSPFSSSEEAASSSAACAM